MAFFAVSFREGSRENDKPEPSFFSVHHQPFEQPVTSPKSQALPLKMMEPQVRGISFSKGFAHFFRCKIRSFFGGKLYVAATPRSNTLESSAFRPAWVELPHPDRSIEVFQIFAARSCHGICFF